MRLFVKNNRNMKPAKTSVKICCVYYIKSGHIVRVEKWLQKIAHYVDQTQLNSKPMRKTLIQLQNDELLRPYKYR